MAPLAIARSWSMSIGAMGASGSMKVQWVRMATSVEPTMLGRPPVSWLPGTQCKDLVVNNLLRPFLRAILIGVIPTGLPPQAELALCALAPRSRRANARLGR
jgi:hypothetical protein